MLKNIQVALGQVAVGSYSTYNTKATTTQKATVSAPKVADEDHEMHEVFIGVV
jgi:hypothetical protein